MILFKKNVPTILFLSSLILTLTFLSHFSIFKKDVIGHHSWRQSWTQTNIRNFTFEDFNILNPRINNMNFVGDERIFRNEFPLYQWLVAAINKLIGYSTVNSRITNFIISIAGCLGFGLALFYMFGSLVAAIAGVWFLVWVPVFYFYSINILPDIFAFSFVLISLGFLLRYSKLDHKTDLILASLFLGIAVLQKLPYIIFLPSFLLAFLFSKNKLQFSLSFIISLLPAIAWYGWVIPKWKNGVTTGILNTSSYDYNQLLDYFKYYTLDCFPKSFIGKVGIPYFGIGLVFFFVLGFYKQKLHLILLISFISVFAYFVFELNMLAYAHDYYLLAFLPFFGYFFIVGLLVTYNKIKWLAFFPLVLMPINAYLKENERWNVENAGYQYNIAKYSKTIQSALPSNAICITGNDESGHIYLYYLNRKGFSFTDNYLDSAWTKDFISRGASYIVADNAYIETTDRLIPFLDSIILVKENIRVIKLKKVKN